MSPSSAGESGVGEDGDGSDLPEHVVEDLLASRRRQRMLAVLAERSTPVVLEDLLRTVLAEERDTVTSDVPRREYAAARAEAYEEHLPKLTAVDVVRYDSLLGTVELTDDAVAERVDAAR